MPSLAVLAWLSNSAHPAESRSRLGCRLSTFPSRSHCCLVPPFRSIIFTLVALIALLQLGLRVKYKSFLSTCYCGCARSGAQLHSSQGVGSPSLFLAYVYIYQQNTIDKPEIAS